MKKQNIQDIFLLYNSYLLRKLDYKIYKIYFAMLFLIQLTKQLLQKTSTILLWLGMQNITWMTF